MSRLWTTTLALVIASAPIMAATCESLSSLTFSDATIASAQTVAAGAFKPPADPNGRGGRGANDLYKDVPAFCRVTATLKPTSDSDIKIEVWLPSSGWNQKYQAVGNGGWAGVISYSAMAEALRDGYATSSTDTGHVGGSGSFVQGHPEKLIDFGWRSEHEMTVKSKAIVAAFYGNNARLSYWNGCSTGGRQGLKEAQKFPADYDGIIAGAPANRTALALWIAFAELKDPATTIPPAKYKVIHQAVLDQCDAGDGLKDGLIQDPTRCHFDPKAIQCKGADGPECLTAPQVEAVRKSYMEATNPRTGQKLFPSLAPGSELGWAVLGAGPGPSPIMLDHYKYVVFKNPNWDWTTFDFDKDIAKSDEPENAVMNATDPNLKSFFSHKGKLLLYHGWADPNISPLSTIQYYKSVVDTNGGENKTSDSVRLFMAPGMGHCGGGEGPNKMDLAAALDKWVDKGTAPDKIIASHSTAGKVDRTRPLCPFPQVAKYAGSGSIDDAANFSCAAPEKATVELDNPWVHVTRVNLAPHEKLAPRAYSESVVVYLADTATHKDGDTAHFAAGKRTEENTTGHPIEEVIVEFKPGAPPLPAHPVKLDPVKLDSEHHMVDFENSHVRVLRTTLVPHLKSPLHEHPSYVVVYLTELHTTMALNDGRQVDNPRRKGEVAWRDFMSHVTENIGDRTAMEIQIELH